MSTPSTTFTADLINMKPPDPPEPPDEDQRMEELPSEKPSFKAILMDKIPDLNASYLQRQGKQREGSETNSASIQLMKDEMQRIHEPWRNSIIVKLFGKFSTPISPEVEQTFNNSTHHARSSDGSSYGPIKGKKKQQFGPLKSKAQNPQQAQSTLDRRAIPTQLEQKAHLKQNPADSGMDPSDETNASYSLISSPSPPIVLAGYAKSSFEEGNHNLGKNDMTLPIVLIKSSNALYTSMPTICEGNSTLTAKTIASTHNGRTLKQCSGSQPGTSVLHLNPTTTRPHTQIMAKAPSLGQVDHSKPPAGKSTLSSHPPGPCIPSTDPKGGSESLHRQVGEPNLVTDPSSFRHAPPNSAISNARAKLPTEPSTPVSPIISNQLSRDTNPSSILCSMAQPGESSTTTNKSGRKPRRLRKFHRGDFRVPQEVQHGTGAYLAGFGE
ncbi:hypothetical protein FXO38_29341 [Capsicum annuum]|nr:hypothetical protein FXO38_29341 [Capsicum annuum]